MAPTKYILMARQLLIFINVSTDKRERSEDFKDTKRAIRNRIPVSKRNRQHKGQKKKYKRTNNDRQNIHIKLKIK
jgi:hypothetical protein